MKPLREYQIKAIDAVKKELDKGINKQLLVMATGTGKTFTAVKAIEQFNFQRVLWITHTEELVQQSALAFLSEKFDKELKYIRHWIPELDSFDYPKPIVVHEVARERVLAVYKKALADK